ncbi:hypothetical protein ACFYE9_07855 [Rhizobium leguminosarum]|uniref:Uncharacterized protein n=1 Tax=Rhizobium leguminosarum TaxID=384 RepID=A0ACD5F4S0_RHILE|nr:hypothetical protein [Rhizobium leguminosarum]
MTDRTGMKTPALPLAYLCGSGISKLRSSGNLAPEAADQIWRQSDL